MQLYSRKSSCGDLQSRLKVRKVLGVGDATGSTSGSKISQILGQSDNLIFNLSPKLATWLFFVATFFSCFSVMGILWPSCLRLILPGGFESTMHLAASYAFLAAVLGLTLRSGDKTSLQLVLCSLILFHGLSFFISLWFLKTSITPIKSTISSILHLFCLLINTHFYRSTNRTVTSSFRLNKLKTYFSSMISFPTAPGMEYTAGNESS
ncbi:unnamed protein product [Rotaria magnacalcarata]|uniref:Tumor protein p53-inducible protein 11 n=1 Tax=Rotaria magnacalcarata TaxID=392030 RepID=A0A816X0S5_9BILA|nr:unnamed protein product [Rotaria magnacalcarata]CAF2140963.1 unnamed protein product [Rotaria magnacalcarata]CAF2158622.1 unnamed protein product [Rotaria magnacalcarata]CAF4031876.1 unnamed protein product [Rotaria magnacalcarata]